MPGIFGIGMLFTDAIANLFRRSNTVLFPTEEVDTPNGFRGRPILSRPEDCIVCHLCERCCPTHTIKIIWDKKHREKGIERYRHRIWIAQCIQCQECVDRCPKDCFDMIPDWKSASLDKNDPTLILEVGIMHKVRKDKVLEEMGTKKWKK